MQVERECQKLKDGDEVVKMQKMREKVHVGICVCVRGEEMKIQKKKKRDNLI